MFLPSFRAQKRQPRDRLLARVSVPGPQGMQAGLVKPNDSKASIIWPAATLVNGERAISTRLELVLFATSSRSEAVSAKRRRMSPICRRLAAPGRAEKATLRTKTKMSWVEVASAVREAVETLNQRLRNRGPGTRRVQMDRHRRHPPTPSGLWLQPPKGCEVARTTAGSAVRRNLGYKREFREFR